MLKRKKNKIMPGCLRKRSVLIEKSISKDKIDKQYLISKGFRISSMLSIIYYNYVGGYKIMIEANSEKTFDKIYITVELWDYKKLKNIALLNNKQLIRNLKNDDFVAYLFNELNE